MCQPMHARFLIALPRIEAHAKVHFRNVRCPNNRADRIAETIALAWKWFARLEGRGKDPTRFVSAIRRSVNGACEQLGIVYDAVGVSGTYGYSATVFLANFFTIPQTESEFLALPKIVYDTLEELVEDGWVID